jgi:pimeloyl-ACP methyl ester carboxylesterase
VSDAPGALLIHERGPLAAGDPTASGPWPYLLVHGSMDRSTSFVRLAARLPDSTVITYDRRGYAGSSARAPSEDFADQVADLLEVVAGREVVAFGHSFGGDVVLAAAQRHPELIRAALVWEAPMPWLPTWPAATAGGAVLADDRDDADVAEAFMRRMVSDRIWERLPATTRAARRREGPALIAEMRSLRSTTPWDPSAVTIPVIVGAGGASREHHRRSAVDLAAALPDAELVAVPEARHGAHLSHPAELAALLQRVARRAMGDGAVLRVDHRPEASSKVAGSLLRTADEENP